MSWVLLTIKGLVLNRVKPYQTRRRTQLGLQDIQHKLQPYRLNNSNVRHFYLGVWNAAYGIDSGGWIVGKSMSRTKYANNVKSMVRGPDQTRSAPR